MYAALTAEKYNINAYEEMINPTKKSFWKDKCKKSIREKTFREISTTAKEKKTLHWLIHTTSNQTHQIWMTCKGSPRQARMARIRARVLIGRYGLNKERAKYKNVNPTCPICHDEEEDEVHFVASCKLIVKDITDLTDKLKDMYDASNLPTPKSVLEITSAILNGHMNLVHNDIINNCNDETLAVKLHVQDWESAHTLTNRIINKLHHQRQKVLERDNYSCIECRQPVRDDDMALSCDTCERWQHIICNNIVTDDEYRDFLNNRAEISWICRYCV